MNRFLQDKFDISQLQMYTLNGREVGYDGRNLYMSFPVSEKEQDQLMERYEILEYVKSVGERFVPQFRPGKDGNYVQQMKKKYFVVLQLDEWQTDTIQSLGQSLAIFHRNGFQLQADIKVLNRVGKWKELWESRIETLAKIWQQTVMNRPANEFERLFVESYPYYSGLTENAIQYFVDTSMDEKPAEFDAGTITHERFSKETWSPPIVWKNPFDWIIDHPTRDIAEWVRTSYFEENSYSFQPIFSRFFQEYQSILPLSSFSWRLLYSRLVLPLHYFQCIEMYYSYGREDLNKTMENILRQYLEQCDEYEEFLAYFFDFVEVPVRMNNIPRLDWLMK